MSDIHFTPAEAKLVGAVIKSIGSVYRIFRRTPLTHTHTLQIDWNAVAKDAGFPADKVKAARDKWYPIRDKLVGAAGGVLTKNAGKKRAAGGDDGDAATPEPKKVKGNKKLPKKAKVEDEEDEVDGSDESKLKEELLASGGWA
ncbi:hypothetical protein LTR62_007641 [Meristemomyces frigidus]|uniref:Uncharacterized protein n=1 Tax=Meristemomyces frigidus TaxID=1508187 RepID=A0AAN7TM48_9PEZI|nr:hypothetical protein LTR62_007641 [Meristemomyces frigidus]